MVWHTYVTVYMHHNLLIYTYFIYHNIIELYHRKTFIICIFINRIFCFSLYRARILWNKNNFFKTAIWLFWHAIFQLIISRIIPKNKRFMKYQRKRMWLCHKPALKYLLTQYKGLWKSLIQYLYRMYQNKWFLIQKANRGCNKRFGIVKLGFL